MRAWREVVLIFSALLSAGVGIYILVATKAATTPGIFAGAGFVALALALAIPSQFKEACTTIAPYVPMIGGRRSGDPRE
jgi:ABC-type uncharacterized transport system permease subunit